jgi:class 3 adenylate cyclase/tetratricopeptide (TPR) repeat protein
MPRCAACGEENPDRFRFCGACGAPLAPSRRQRGQERRLVTVLFSDLVGFTARSDQADPEDVGALLRPYHGRLRAEIERFGGTLDKFIGDAVLAVFGAPVAHEDDPERGVRCALGMLAAIAELNQAHPDLALSVRIAIATGQALVTPGQETEGVVGDVVNTASRLQGVAPAGGVVVGEGTWRATRRQFEYQQLEPVRVKGKADPVPIWRLLEATSRTGADTVRQRSPLVGREQELDRLRRLLEGAMAERTARLVSIVGEPGVGKSRLVGELHEWLDARPELVAWRQGRCLPYGEGVTFWALGEIVKAQAGILESDEPSRAAAKLEASVAALLAEASERGWLKARLAALLGLAASEAAAKPERAELFAAWRRFLEAIAADRPLVLVVEDLHWADPAMLEFLEDLVDHSTEVALLVVTTARPELLERHPGWGAGGPHATQVALAPLDDGQTAHLIAALLGRPVLPAELQALLLERAGGNPLYAEEFTQLLADRDLLAGDRLAATTGIPVPETVESLIAARLDTLAQERKALLQDAAVVGRVFWSGALAAIGGVEAAEVRPGLQVLERKQLVRQARTSSVEHQDEYGFWHALVRDVCYAQIPRAGRARRHRAAAEWLEEVAGDRVADLAEILAHHYRQALTYARAAGGHQAQADQLEGPTRRVLVLAGDRAANLDIDRARTYYEQAIGLCPPDHPERPRLRVKVGWVAFQSGKLAEAAGAYEEAIAGLRGRQDVHGLGMALDRLATVRWNQGDTRGAREALVEGIEVLEREPPSPELCSLYAQMAVDRVMSGHDEEALGWAEKALALADGLGGLPEVRLRALDARGMARCDLGDLGGVEDLRAALALGLEVGAGYDTAVIYNNLAEPLWLAEGPAVAMAVCQEGIEFAERRGLAEGVIWLQTSVTSLLFDLGRWDEALAASDQVIASDRAHGGDYAAVGAQRYAALIHVWRGELGAARELLGQVLPKAREIGDLQQLIPTLVLVALVEYAGGDQAAALALVQEVGRITGDHAGGRWYRGQHLPDLVRLCARAAPALARELVEHGRVDVTRHRVAMGTAMAVLAETAGDLEEAAVLYAEAAAGWSAYGHVLEHGLALLGGGRCLLRLGRAAEAASNLQAADDIFSGLRARPQADEASSLLGRASAPDYPGAS